MPESPSKSGTMDQGLFFAHFNRAKEFFDQARYHDAERELDEAYLLRPHDPRVLNLLGLVCFKQDRYEKAEEVYRKLVNQNPNSATLYFNLGLIYYKISRLDEAENAFVKAIEFSPSGNSKISFYLGSVYEKLHRFQDAIFQYRQAGANVMVRRMEDRMSPTTLPPSPPIEAIAAPKTAQNASVEAASEDKASAVDTTEEFPAKSVVPVSSAVMAAEVDKISTADTGRFHETSNTSPFALNIAAAHLDPPPGTRANKPKEIFRILENRLVEVDFSGKVFIKQGTIYSYSGNLTFWVKEKRPTGPPPLVILTGKGRVIMKDREREITLMYIDDGPFDGQQAAGPDRSCRLPRLGLGRVGHHLERRHPRQRRLGPPDLRGHAHRR
ncbi:MAG: tetratricopeptide repeat protein [Vicinamibacteria bacterium]|nr:tetratricopeptide repeat protein [Vicinamibacteria bacterium]